MSRKMFNCTNKSYNFPIEYTNTLPQAYFVISDKEHTLLKLCVSLHRNIKSVSHVIYGSLY
jgi:hypothetical protein